MATRLRGWTVRKWRDCSLPKRPDQLWGPPSLLLSEYGRFVPGGKVDHSRPPRAKVRN